MNIQLNKELLEPDFQLQISDKKSKAAILVLSNNGEILDINEEGMKLLEYAHNRPAQLHILNVLPELGKIDLYDKVSERVNPYLRFLSRIGHIFKIITTKGKRISSELYFNDLQYFNRQLILVMIYPVRGKKNNIYRNGRGN
ncbi:MAG: hypothetical protein MRK00_04000 [Nitrosomonas sp.]|nr:hypothetical protein [Nitrosomonas sp.]